MYWQTRQVGRWRWQVQSPHHDLPDNGPDFENLAADPRATLIKQNDVRDVWRVDDGTRAVYAKVIRVLDGWSRWRHRLLGSTAEREKRVADYALRLGIATVEPIAIARAPFERDRPSVILITVEFPHAVPLDQLHGKLDLSDPSTRAQKNRVIDATAHLIAKAHLNGFHHMDLHAGNILVSTGPDACTAAFVDLQNVRVGRRMDDEAVVRSLAQFNQWFRIRGLLTDRIRFLNRYLHWRDMLMDKSSHPHRLGMDRRALVRALNRAADVHAEKLYSKRDHRVLRRGKYFDRIHFGGGWRGYVYLGTKQPMPGSRASQLTFTREQWRDWLADPVGFAQENDHRRVIKDSPSSRVCRRELEMPGNQRMTVVCKRFVPRSLWKRLYYCVRRSRPLRTWVRANALLHRGIPTARPLAVLERRRCGLLLDSLIITELVEEGVDLDTFLAIGLRRFAPGHQRTIRCEVIRDLVTILCRLEQCRLVHRDLKSTNIMVQTDSEHTSAPRLLLVDLDGLRRRRPWHRETFLRTLMRLNVSIDHCRHVRNTDRLRLLKQFLRASGRGGMDWKTVWRRIARLSNAKRILRARRHQQQVRQLQHA